MRTLPPEPNPGDKISATLIREIIRALRERTIIQGPGVKTSIGPNGTVVSANPGEGGKYSGSYPQAFDIKKIDENEVVFTNCYYQVGGVTHCIECLDDGEYTLSSNEVKGNIVAYYYGNNESASLYMYGSISAMNSAQENRNNFIRPLYWFNEDMSVKIDFRSMPDFGQWEAE